MRTLHSLRAAAAALVITLLAHPAAGAQDADTQEVTRYVLTDAGLAKYARAVRSLAALPSSCDDESTGSIAGMVGKIDAKPAAKAAIQAAGMTSREYVVFSMSILQNGLAAWALTQPGGTLPAGVSKANVDFIKRHEAELKQLEGVSKGDCDDDGQ